MAQKLVETNVVRAPEHRGDERLSRAGAGSSYRVARLHGDEAFRGKMMALGIVAGAAITVVQGGGGRPLVIALGRSRLLLDSRSAELVSLSRCGNSADESGLGS